MARSACLIFNAFSGQGNPVTELIAIRAILEPEINLDICPINSREVDPVQLTHAAIKRGAEMAIASGGDGTVSAVAEALIGTGIPLGIIPRGTANAFATALGIPLEIKVACETILQGSTHLVDAAFCNGKPMILLAGIGFEAETIKQANRKAKNRLGKLAYILAGVKQFLYNFKPFQTYIKTEDQTINLQATAVTIANAAPVTSFLAHGTAGVIVDDGLLDITIVTSLNRTNALFAAYHLLRTGFIGTSTNREDINYLRARNIRVETQPPQRVVLDGNLIGTTPVEIECIPKALNVLIPSINQPNLEHSSMISN